MISYTKIPKDIIKIGKIGKKVNLTNTKSTFSIKPKQFIFFSLKYSKCKFEEKNYSPFF